MLVGRDREIRLLDGLLDDARAGRSAVLALVGEVGVGKTVLLDHAAAAGAASGMHVLRARGIQSEAHIPFAGLFELLRPALGHLDGIAQRQREALEGALALRPARAQDRFAVGAATLNLLAASSEEAPLLVVVDDAHWIDGSSADALLFAIRRLVADPIAVVLAVRDDEPSLLDGADLPLHRVEGLDRAAAGALVTLPDEAIDRLHRQTGGNPLALLELAEADAPVGVTGALDAPLPVMTSVARVYLERAAALPEAARDGLLLAAASNTGELALIARAAAIVGADLAGLEAVEGSGLFAIVDDRIEFRHPLVRSAIYAGAPAARRREVHRALAAALPDMHADRRAWHLALAAFGPDEAASSALEQAGRRAQDRSAYDVASQAYERAAALAPDEGRRCALLQAAADTAWLAGSARRAVGLLDQAHRGTPPPAVAVAIEHLRGRVAARLGPVRDGHRILLDGARMAADIDPDRAVVMLAEAVNAAFYAGDATGMAEAAALLPSLVGPASSRRTVFFAQLARGMALIFGGEGGERGATLVREAVTLAEGSDELSDDPRLLAWAAMGPLWLREAEADRSLMERALEQARLQSVVGVLPFLLSHVAIDAMASDRWDEAEAGFHEAISLARESGQRADLAAALARLAWLEARQGKEVACRDHGGEARALARELDFGLSDIWALAALADLELGLGHLDEARQHLEAEQAALVAHGVGDVDLSPEPELVDVYLRLGRRDEAEACLASFAESAERKGQPWALARAARCRGLLAADDDLDRHFDEALALHDETADVFERARTLLAYGGRLRRARQRMRAREHLRAATADFDRLGAAPWSDMARAELAATGESARRRDPSTRDQLTPQEMQIALLLAGGRTTREAAATLFLSPKTVEYHLHSVYRKLGINSREQLAASLAGAGP